MGESFAKNLGRNFGKNLEWNFAEFKVNLGGDLRRIWNVGKNWGNNGETQEDVFGISLGISLNMNFVGLGARGAEREGSGRRQAVAEALGGKKVVEEVGMGQGGRKGREVGSGDWRWEGRRWRERERESLESGEVAGGGCISRPCARKAGLARKASLKLCARSRPCPPPCRGSLMKSCGTQLSLMKSCEALLNSILYEGLTCPMKPYKTS